MTTALPHAIRSVTGRGVWVVVTMLSDAEIYRIGSTGAQEGGITLEGLRAVEAAVRADQIEKDAAIADDRHRKPQDEPALIAWRIRAQLNGENG